jgi:competence protein ComGC
LSAKIRASKRKQENGVTGSMMLITFFVTALILLLTLPNIYLDNQIYYESRAIAHAQNVKLTLEEEQRIIKTKLEEINYKENLLNRRVK